MSTYQLVHTFLTIVFGVATFVLGYKAYLLNHRKLALEHTVDEIKKFDQTTAFSMFRTARQHEHNTWMLWKHSLDKLAKQHPQIAELIDIVGDAGRIYGDADVLVTNAIQMYRLSGADIIESKVDQWIRDGLIPDHYKPRFMGLVG